ncbi:MAG: right-handed parallel beta-helix repeat-containing protein [Verrucomicrobia bacterium]|nr:right-handed parallel beta-helix repeat-containing protein [Verrucomicrobiota bacterium]
MTATSPPSRYVSRELTVAKDHSGGFTNIQAAIDAAPSNAVVRLGPGVFEECLTIEKPLTLEGAGWEKTLLRKEPGPEINSEKDLLRLLEPRLKAAASDDERRAILQEFMQQHGTPVLTVRNTKGVQVRGLRFTNPRPGGGGSFPNEYVVRFTNAQAAFAECAVVGGPGIGVLIGKAADVEMSRCLVAAMWGTGIEVGERSGPATGARIADSDVRNCHYAGIKLAAVGQSATVEHCRISGAAWHGIRYGDSSPTIVSNLIFQHARCGIYAGGKSAAVVRQNLFYRNEMNGISCWSGNRDVIEGNTFAENAREGVALVDAAWPVLRQNIFTGHQQAIVQARTASRTNDPAGTPRLEQNWFWRNATNWPPAMGSSAKSLETDPRFQDAANHNFALAADSPARRDKIGAADPIPFASPWPLQPEELAMIPEGATRDSREWKDPRKLARNRGMGVPLAGSPTNREGRTTVAATTAAPRVSYEEAFRDLYDVLARDYPCFELKSIDWRKVGDELLPRAKQVKTDDEFGLLCMELVARLEDSHSYLMAGSARLPSAPFPQWDPGFACLIGDHEKPVIHHVDKESPADQAGVRIGMTVLSLNGQPAEQALKAIMQQAARHSGYSSERYLRYHAAQWLGRQTEKGSAVVLETQSPDGQTNRFNLTATLGARYLPRLPVPIPGIRDSGDVSWTRLTNNVGYIYVRRIGEQLIARLDQAVAELKDVRGLIVDVRGNSGGGFDGSRALRNFSLTDTNEPERPRFLGPMALLIDARCISAGEGWASWFVAQKRARFFGEATAGASSQKSTYTLKNGLFKVQYSVRPYTGFLNRPIERRGLEPEVPVRQTASDLAAGRDTVLEAARKFLEDQRWDGSRPVAVKSQDTPSSGSTPKNAPKPPLPPISPAEELPGTLIFHGRYQHRTGGKDSGPPSELWLKQSANGGLSALAQLPAAGTIELAVGDQAHRFIEHRVRGQKDYGTDLSFRDGEALLTRRGFREDRDGWVLSVPKDAWFDPNTRPDAYCAANVLLRAFALKPGESRELQMFDLDNSGELFVSYRVKIAHAGKEKIEVPAGAFEANHLVLTQLTAADTWFKKRGGHITDFWVLDNHVIVRVLRHREPYEMRLLNWTVPAKLPGQ